MFLLRSRCDASHRFRSSTRSITSKSKETPKNEVPRSTSFSPTEEKPTPSNDTLNRERLSRAKKSFISTLQVSGASRPLPSNPIDRIKPIPHKHLLNVPSEYLLIKEMVERTDAISDEEFGHIMENLFPNPSKAYVGAAISGGVDSMCLAILLKKWCQIHNRTFVGFIVDHGVRKESSDEAKLVLERLKRLDIDAEILTIDWKLPIGNYKNTLDKFEYSGKEAQINSLKQDDFRQKRMEILRKACKRRAVEHLLLAQHFDDCIETLFMRFALGSGIHGYSTIESWRQVDPKYALVRPLLRFGKAQLISTCIDRRVPWVEDPSNKSMEYYRNRIRKIIAQEGFFDLIPKEDFAFFINQMNQNRHEMIRSVSEFVNRSVTQDFWYGHLTMQGLNQFVRLNPVFSTRVLAHLIRKITGEEVLSPAKLYDTVLSIKQFLQKKNQKEKGRITACGVLFFWKKGDNQLVCVAENKWRQTELVPLKSSAVRWKNFIINRDHEKPSEGVEAFIRPINPTEDFEKIYKMVPSLRRKLENVDFEVKSSVPVVVDKKGNILAIPHFKYFFGLNCQVKFDPLAGGAHRNLDLIFHGEK